MYIPDLGPDWAAQGASGSSTDPLTAAGLVVADLTGDGRLDVYLPQVGPDRLFVAQPDGTMSDESLARLPGPATPTSSATAADIEGDGDLDLYLSVSDGDDVLLINDGTGTFSDGTAAAGLAGQAWKSAHATFGDMDGDQDLDLFVVTFRNCEFEDPSETSPRALWQNQGDGTFVDVTESLMDHPGVRGRFRAAAWIDVDRDQDQDLHVVADLSMSGDCMHESALYVNEGDSLVKAPAGSGLDLRIEGMGLAIGDLNDDAIPDFVVSDMQRVWMVESLGENTWFDSTFARGIQVDPDSTDRWSAWGTELADLDNDGDLDLYVGFGVLPDAPDSSRNPTEQPDALFLQDADGMFSEVSATWGLDGPESTRAVILADLNGDGWLDLARRSIDGDATIFMANCGANSWLQVDLRAPAPNHHAVGAVVAVHHDERTWHRWVTAGGSSLQSSMEPTVHFGLGGATEVELEVQWPDGAVSRFDGVQVNQTVTITRDEG